MKTYPPPTTMVSPLIATLNVNILLSEAVSFAM